MTENKKQNKIVHELIKKIDSDPQKAENYFDLSALLIEQQSFDQAEELLNKALGSVQDADGVDLIQFGLGNLYYTQSEYDKTIQIMQRINSEKLQPDANQMIAQSYFAQNKYQIAFAFALTAQEKKQPNDISINSLLGDITLAMGDLDSAEHYYDIVLSGDSRNASSLFNRGIIEMVLHDGGLDNHFFKDAKAFDSELFEKNKNRLIDIDSLINNGRDSE
ncbi:tetratricopeptide repeat protein [Pediococcus claussenii]|uniref:Anaphase-promoting complex, cyclosome, subunit 3 family protein n=1 Tax=Pediococcus claussenii (strain ATCC BAA-344 / DSM 14800 / JCM 18046 / KCTC 3811 / LMG 21948 / P06) TaxID=701521 RepID=G8PCW0_PEDCP|nr:tetratricopeptide repeat protein [Pediococcus claussenii]AEV95095.1 anaphase-promoting complex, cyclosome, subunit 3 family protein [Pediococcus claussenii ATCC BAA-344]ANZ70283.1 hypothetical protein AYR57_08125 [Pediococcus claussenii]ANZ72099.1 hypothetical protein AYR58_08125 [Pediococcus claussenii]KRN18956.1 hypothetical protein IV79_GL001800 [Pediococcus claussenii]